MSLQCGDYTRTVLIIDDFEVERLCCQRYLEHSTRYRYQFVTSEVGEEASFLYQRYQPNVILLDYSLPSADPLDVIKKL